jgi:hypothetical protein
LPIIPGKGLGGLSLGMSMEALNGIRLTPALEEPEEWATLYPDYFTQRDPWFKVEDGEIVIIVSRRSSLIRAIYAAEGYQGNVLSTIDLSMTYGEALKVRPGLILDDQACFYDLDCPGYFLKDYENDLDLFEILSRRITWIGVYLPNDTDFDFCGREVCDFP